MTLPRDAQPSPSLGALQAFESVARHRNFARAAAELQVTPTAMSKTIKGLETQLGVRLFNRTTRSVGLTEHGSQLLAALAPALVQIQRAVQQVSETAHLPQGLLRLNTSYVAFAALIQPFQAGFLARHPGVTLEVSTDDRLVDIVAGGYDAGIRLGHALQRDMVAVPLGGPQRTAVIAAPRYLAQRGTPRQPGDLLAHDCIRQRLAGTQRSFEWRFGPRERPLLIEVRGPVVYSEMRCVVDAVRQGLGLGYVYRQFAEEHLRSGELTTVLDAHATAAEAFYLYHPHRAPMAGKLRAFIDHMQAQHRALAGAPSAAAAPPAGPGADADAGGPPPAAGRARRGARALRPGPAGGA